MTILVRNWMLGLLLLIVPTGVFRLQGEEPQASQSVATADEHPYRQPPMPPFRVLNEGFDASEQDIHALLTSTGRELWRYFPDYEIEPFVIRRGHEGPIVLHQRNDDGEIVMRLDTGDTYWAQYAFQFGHEFCHILCRYDNDYQGNQWFEESLCETASLFVLRQMADAWREDPPYRHWRDYGDKLRTYATQRMELKARVAAEKFPHYVRENQQALLHDAKYQEFNRSVAVALLPMLEQEPARWESIRWLNSKPATEGETLNQYFQKWHSAVPQRHRAFVQEVAELFDVEMSSIDAEDADPATKNR